MAAFKFVEGTHYKTNPQIVGEELARLNERDGCLKAQTVVDEARPELSPLHPEFEWDDLKAAEAFRKDQAAKLIRCIRVVKGEDSDGESILERVFITVAVDGYDKPATYYTAAKVLSTSELRQQAISDAVAYLSRARSRLSEYKELEKQYVALEKIENDLVEAQMKIVRRERARETTQALVVV